MLSKDIKIRSYGPTTLEILQQYLETLTRRTIEAHPKRAAVLIPLCCVQSQPSILFTRRSDHVSTHKGQVSFPGGMVDDDDSSPVTTALREWEEELGVSADFVEVLGMFHDVLSITGVAVTPIVGYLGDLEQLPPWAPNAHEIDSVFTLTLNELSDPALRSTQNLPHRGQIPVFSGGPAPVWGLTAYILDEFLRAVHLTTPR
ncbi:MAG: CoA pyrophosphatase [Myxococcales bacterium]|nr:CoA pyrophosphatase [Myxococcales bacterium]